MKSVHSRKMLMILGVAAVLVGLLIAMFYVVRRNNVDIVDARMARLIASSGSVTDKRSISDQVHKIGHEIGESDNSGSLDSALKKCGDPDFIKGGCLHGVVMGLEHHYTKEQLAKKCTEKTLSDLRFNKNCAHAIGHILFTEQDQLNSYLTSCDSLFPVDLRNACYSGVFMEYMLASHSIAMGEPKTILRIPDCKKVPESYTMICAGSIGSYTQYYPNDSLEKTVSLCQELQTQEQQQYCFDSARDRLRLASQETQSAFCRLIICQ